MSKKIIRTSFSILASLAIISCSVPINNLNEGIGITKNASVKSSVINGTVEFNNPSSILPLQKEGGKENTRHSPPVTRHSFSSKATLGDVGNQAVVSLLLPPDDGSNPNVTIATGLTDESGVFTINVGFTPVPNKVYILEASKRIGSAGNDVISVRTYVRHNGLVWESITGTTININTKTTAVAIIDSYDNSIDSEDTIGTIVDGTVGDIGIVTATTINGVADIASSVIDDSRDPVRFISYLNNKYYIVLENAYNKNYLLANKTCRSCDLQSESLSNADLTNSDLSHATLTMADFRNANLTGVNLTGVTATRTDFTGAIWRNGGICQTGSIGNCILPDILVITWESFGQDGSGSGIYRQRFSSTGTTRGSEFKVNTFTTDNQTSSSVAIDTGGNFVITFGSNGQDGSGDGIYLQRYDNFGLTK